MAANPPPDAGPSPDGRPTASPTAPAAPDDPVERILAECMADEAVDIASRVEVACQRFPEHATELRARVCLLAEVGFLDAPPAAPPAIPGRLGGFRLIRRIGSGGMGVVYLAHEEALDRTVALKLVRPEYLHFPDSLARFRREVKVIAGLRHPGIVPVFAVGEAQGIPFFTMERVAGCNLLEVSTALQGRRPERLGGQDLAQALAARLPAEEHARPEDAERVFGRSWQEVCLRLVVQAAEALAHVHEQGILHRDIKPSNLMVTGTGRVMLLDFGLSASEGSARLTRSGALAGSLLYMSPEQLRGGIEGLDARTDVYSLGVTLYELLTLVCPHQGKDVEDTRRRILEGRVAPLREHNRAVTWDAETVCLTAMDRDPGRRYASAADLARDLRNVLEYRPIAARRPGPLLRLKRLSQRRRALAVAVVAAFLFLVTAPTIWALVERDASARIERNLAQAVQAVNQMLTRVGSSRLMHMPQADAVRRQLLEDALKFCRRLLAENPTHPRVNQEMAEVLQSVAWFQLKLGDATQAEQTLADAIRLHGERLRREPGTRNGLWGMAVAEEGMTGVMVAHGRRADAETWQRRSVEHRLELARRFPGDRDVTCLLAEGWAILGSVLQRGSPEAIQAVHTAVDLLEPVVAREPGNVDVVKALIRALDKFEWAYDGQPAEVEPRLRRAVQLSQALVERFPGNDEHLDKLGWARNHLGDVLRTLGLLAESEQEHRAALAARERLVATWPGRITYLADLGDSLSAVAVLRYDQGDLTAARQFLERAVQARSRALSAGPDHAHRSRLMLHRDRVYLAHTLIGLQEPAAVLELAPAAEDDQARTAEELCARAQLLCLCIAVHEADEPHPEEVEALGLRAVDCLRKAAAAGMVRPDDLRHEAYRALRRRADYRQLLAERKAAAAPSKR